MTIADADSSGGELHSAPATGPAATAADLRPGALIFVPVGAAGRRRSFCLRITQAISISQETGAATLHGNVLGADGTTTRSMPLTRTVTALPPRLTLVRAADLAAAPVYLDVRPSRTQVAVMVIPAGITVRLRCWDNKQGDWVTREMHDPDHPMILEVPGDWEGIGWHVRHARLSGPDAIGRRTVAQDVWQEATRRIEGGGVVYVELEHRQATASGPGWFAVGVTDGPPLPGREPARPQ